MAPVLLQLQPSCKARLLCCFCPVLKKRKSAAIFSPLSRRILLNFPFLPISFFGSLLIHFIPFLLRICFSLIPKAGIPAQRRVISLVQSRNLRHASRAPCFLRAYTTQFLF